MPEPRSYVQHRNSLMMLVGAIPGFHGYLEREYRRDSDALQRTWLADRLQRSKRAMDAVALKLADAGKIAILPQFDRLRAKTDELIARIRGAWEGYTGVFDLVKVDQALLDQVYDHDVLLMHSVDEYVAMTEHLAGMPPSGDAIAKPPAAVAPPVAAAAPPADNPVPGSPPPSAAPAEDPVSAANTMPSDPEAAIPILAAKLDTIQQNCDQRTELLKGLA
jgi:hypothetical protein